MEANDRVHMTVAAIDNADRAELCLRESRWPFLAKLHGDFQSVELKNTTDELKEQDAKMRRVLTAACARFGLVVIGYSGRDASVMDALTEALSAPNAFPGGIFWVARSAHSVLPAVATFLEAARQAGISAAIVESQTFDELAADIADNIAMPPRLLSHVYQSRPEPVLRDVPLPTQERRPFPVLQCSAIPILSMLTVARRIEVNAPITTVRARELLREAEVRALAVSNGRDIAAFGSDGDLERAFASVGGRLAGTIELHPDKDSWALGLLYDALTRAVCRGRPLFARMRRRGHFVLVANGSPKDSKAAADLRNEQLSRLKQAYSFALVGRVPNHNHPFNEGVKLRLDQAAGRWWCVFEPMTHVEIPCPDGNEGLADDESPDFAPVSLRQGDPVVEWVRERWATRFNPVWARIISAWADLLVGQDGDTLCALGLHEGSGVDAVFQLSPVTGWSRPSHEHDYFLRGGR